jgi:hypothetical protein
MDTHKCWVANIYTESMDVPVGAGPNPFGARNSLLSPSFHRLAPSDHTYSSTVTERWIPTTTVIYHRNKDHPRTHTVRLPKGGCERSNLSITTVSSSSSLSSSSASSIRTSQKSIVGGSLLYGIWRADLNPGLVSKIERATSIFWGEVAIDEELKTENSHESKAKP